MRLACFCSFVACALIGFGTSILEAGAMTTESLSGGALITGVLYFFSLAIVFIARKLEP